METVDVAEALLRLDYQLAWTLDSGMAFPRVFHAACLGNMDKFTKALVQSKEFKLGENGEWQYYASQVPYFSGLYRECCAVCKEQIGN